MGKRKVIASEEGEKGNNNVDHWEPNMAMMDNAAAAAAIAALGGARRARKRNNNLAASMASSPNLVPNNKGFEAAAEGDEVCNIEDFFSVPNEDQDFSLTTSSSSSEMDCGSSFAKPEDDKQKLGLEEEGIEDMGKLMDLQLEDALGLPSYFSNPFQIAEEMVLENQPLMEQQETYGNNYNEHDEDPSMLRETMKRMKFERNFSASLYAFNGIPECLRLKQSGNHDIDKSPQQYSKLNPNIEKKFEIKEEHEQVAMFHEETESSAYSSSISINEAAHEIWGSLDLPPICSMNQF
ncbi:hypothetical protein COLO4_27970 [Corchorus olitorius]|uniref:Uncharacterized protein n=1 Tax=Corchorus olitorius TaxID=93759 RepID=A0A1R3HNG1_9ROSI|nr:hypothetical protein COLO4_27970 [Corchorus olitorius]